MPASSDKILAEVLYRALTGREFCVWCRPSKGDVCDASGPILQEGISGYFCTRESGHSGPHVACTLGLHQIALWYDDDDHYTFHIADELIKKEATKD